jgi:hypothetical protein
MELAIDCKQPVIKIEPQNEMTELNAAEIEEVSGGFVCGGLCVAGAFMLGAAVGAGAVVLVKKYVL